MIIQFGQSEEMFGENEFTLLVLQNISEEKKQIKNNLKNFKKAILKFNEIGIEIDISIRYDTVIVQKTD